MKTLFILAWIIACIAATALPGRALAQMDDQFNCGMTGFGSPTATQKGAQWMSNKDTLNVLIVFVQFPDDQYEVTDPLWPKDQAPTFANTFIDSLPSQMSSNGNLTHYFREMSSGTLKLTGKTRFMITPHSRQWYLDNGWCRWLINKEVLESLDASLDFSEFDRWRRYAEYDVRRESDGWVDMVFMVYRNVAQEFPDPRIVMNQLSFQGGEASLGYSYDCGGPDNFVVDGGQRRIGHGFPRNTGQPGEGITLASGLGGFPPFRGCIHELSHHWMSDGSNFGHNGGGFWAMLNNALFRYNAASVRCVNSFEREMVGWHYPDSIGTGGGHWENLSLPDFIATNKSYKIKVPGGNPDEFFRLENHQRISQFDTPEMLDPTAKGLYVIHQFGTDPDQNLRLEPADGRWDWVVQEAGYVSWYSLPLPVYRKTGPDRVNGYNDSWVVPFTWSPPPVLTSPMEVILWRDATNQLIEKPLIRGDGSDAFRLEKNAVFSPWSNPSSQNQAKAKTWIAIEVVNELTNGTVEFNLYIDSVNCLLASPSKPEGLQVTVYPVNGPSVEVGYPKLRWLLNEEPDVISGGSYLIERRTWFGAWDSWVAAATVSADKSEWVDSSFSTAGVGQDSLLYRIRARDASQKLSAYSDAVVIPWTGQVIVEKPSTLGREGLPLRFDLHQNYPNPFNPSTIIKYDLPADAQVTLRIYTVLGKEVATLADGFVQAGYHQINLNAANLASGLYFYRLRAGTYTSTKKLVVLR